MGRTFSSPGLRLSHSCEFKHPVLQCLHIHFIQTEMTGNNLALEICTYCNIRQYSSCQKIALHLKNKYDDKEQLVKTSIHDSHLQSQA